MILIIKYFSIPADFKKETIDKYESLNKQYKNSQVFETFGQITVGNTFESGRALDVLPQVDINQLKAYVEYSRSKGINFNYTINASYMGNKEFSEEGITQTIKFIDELYNAGIRSLTIAMPSLIELIRIAGYDFEIKASTICQVTNAFKASSFKKMGVDRIVVDESINRDFKTLKSIRETIGERVELIVNTICLKNCINRMFHYNQISGDSVSVSSKASVNYYSHRCMMKRCEDVSNIMRISWIRPEDLKYYTDIGICYFKIQGRQTVMKGDPIRAVEAYFKEDYDGNLIELLDLFAPTNSFVNYVDNKKIEGFLEPFVKNSGFCTNSCDTCNYCTAFAKKCIDYEKANKVNSTAKSFYSGYDQFINLVEKVKSEAAAVSNEAEFDFD